MRTLSFKVLSVLAALALLVPVFLVPTAAAVAMPGERSQWEMPVKTTCLVSGHVVYEFDDGSRVRVIHNTPGSILLGFGGPNKCERNAAVKEDLVLQLIEPSVVTTPNTEPELVAPEADAGIHRGYYAPRNFFDHRSKSFGDSVVRTSQQGTADRSRECLIRARDRDEVVWGHTETSWLGSIPQSNSDEIKLAEGWTFRGVRVTVSFPPGLGFSGGGNTVSWFAHDTSGQEWRKIHSYTGIAASAMMLSFTGLTKTATGSHLFGNQWITAAVHTSNI